jgi:hypothetical protein
MPHIPKLLRFMALHTAGGIAAGWIVLLLILKLDTFGLNTLIRGSNFQATALVMLFVMFAVTFGAVGVTIAVLTMEGDAFRDKAPEDEDDARNGEGGR